MAINEVTSIDVKTLPPFKRLIMTLGELPTSYLESMTYAELLMWFCNFLQEKVLPTINNNADALQEVITYLENLDLQDEVNNKLDEMVEDGTLETIITEYIKLIQPNKNFDLKLGSTTWYHNAEDGGANALQQNLTYFDNVIQAIIIQYNTSTEEFELASSNQELQNTNIQNYINNGGILKGVKFHLASGVSLETLFSTYTSNTICQAYGTFILNYLDTLSYKSNISNVWILNEGNSGGNTALSSTYASDVVSLINRVKNFGYTVSLPLTPYGLNKCDQSIINAMDFVSINTYPNAYSNFDWQNSTLEDVINRYNYDYEIIERYIKNKNLYVTEFGCSASWSSFVRPADYYDDHQGKPISLMIEGFYKSKFSSKCFGASLWYFANAIEYAPYTLLSIKKNTEVRYAK